jgi:endonuclease-3
VAPDCNRTVFEQLLFACCLENAHYESAELAFAALADPQARIFFDWNEVRVSTVRELAEAMASLPDPPTAANRVKRVLQSIFESTYSFDLEELRKQNLGPAVDHLRKLDGTTNFSVAYVIQAALGGHAIPVDGGTLEALLVVDLVTEEDVREGVVPGLDRAIPKSRGLEFASQLHQLGADFIANRFAPGLHKVLLEIDPTARQRLPKRRAKGRTEPGAGQAEPAKGREKAAKGSKKRARAEAAGNLNEAKAKPPGRKKKSTQTKKGTTEDPGAGSGEKETSAQESTPSAAKKKSNAPKKRANARKKTEAGKAKSQGEAGTGKSASAGLSKRKPR